MSVRQIRREERRRTKARSEPTALDFEHEVRGKFTQREAELARSMTVQRRRSGSGRKGTIPCVPHTWQCRRAWVGRIVCTWRSSPDLNVTFNTLQASTGETRGPACRACGLRHRGGTDYISGRRTGVLAFSRMGGLRTNPQDLIWVIPAEAYMADLTLPHAHVARVTTISQRQHEADRPVDRGRACLIARVPVALPNRGACGVPR